MMSNAIQSKEEGVEYERGFRFNPYNQLSKILTSEKKEHKFQLLNNLFSKSLQIELEQL